MQWVGSRSANEKHRRSRSGRRVRWLHIKSEELVEIAAQLGRSEFFEVRRFLPYHHCDAIGRRASVQNSRT